MKTLKYLLIVVVLASCKSVKYPDLENGLYADVQTNKGDILIKLHKDVMPMTVANFVSLAEGDNPKVSDSLKGKPYYDKTKFHRVIKDFMIQGGDITGTGRGNAGYRFADEFPLNEEGKLVFSHDGPGVLSMANSGPETNSSQFFITHKETPWLNGKHSVFGRVLKGQKIVDTIAQNDFINRVDIIRVGDEAKKFDAPKVFENELANVESKREEIKRVLENKKRKFQEEMGLYSATPTDSGLKIFKQVKNPSGKKVVAHKPTSIHYTIYLADGKKIQSSKDKGDVFTFQLDDASKPMIPGVKEGALALREGEKARLFIPYYLAYGEQAVGPFPAKSDVVFEIEILKVGK